MDVEFGSLFFWLWVLKAVAVGLFLVLALKAVTKGMLKLGAIFSVATVIVYVILFHIVLAGNKIDVMSEVGETGGERVNYPPLKGQA